LKYIECAQMFFSQSAKRHRSYIIGYSARRRDGDCYRVYREGRQRHRKVREGHEDEAEESLFCLFANGRRPAQMPAGGEAAGAWQQAPAQCVPAGSGVRRRAKIMMALVAGAGGVVVVESANHACPSVRPVGAASPEGRPPDRRHHARPAQRSEAGDVVRLTPGGAECARRQKQRSCTPMLPPSRAATKSRATHAKPSPVVPQ